MEQSAKWSLGAAVIAVVGLILYVSVKKKNDALKKENAELMASQAAAQKANQNVRPQPVDLAYYKIMTPVQLNALNCDALSNHYSMLERQYTYLLSKGQAPYKGYVDAKGATWNNSDSIALKKHMDEVLQVMGSKGCSIMIAD